MKVLTVRQNSKPLQFVVVSGLGWCLDLCLFYLLVRVAGLLPGVSNFISATIAAMAVFLVSRRLVFRARHRGAWGGFVYFAYTEANIVVWALLIEWLSRLGAGLFAWEMATAGLVAKALVTPLSLACNYVVSRRVSGEVKE